MIKEAKIEISLKDFETIVRLGQFIFVALRKNNMKEYEIWIGNEVLPQGASPRYKPELIGKVKASSFRVACYIWSLEFELSSIKRRMDEKLNIEDIHFGKFDYDPVRNASYWLGKFYTSYDEAFPYCKEEKITC